MLDLLIKNARICDGTGAPSVMGDLGVKDGIIRSVGAAKGETAERVLDATQIPAPVVDDGNHATATPWC